jgi:hypothetical protein
MNVNLAGVTIEAKALIIQNRTHSRIMIKFSSRNNRIVCWWGETEWNRFLEIMRPVVEEYQRLKNQKGYQLSEKDIGAFM